MLKTSAVFVAALAVTAGALTPNGADARSASIKRTAYGLTGDGSLVRFDATNTSRTRRVGRLTGLAAGERLVGLDFRPATGELIGLSNRSNLYMIGQNSARLFPKSSLRTMSGEAVTLRGTRFGMDFNPTSDRLRITSDAEENLRINVETGVTAVDTPVSSGAGRLDVVGAAYTNNDNDSFVTAPGLIPFNRSAATGTKLFTIDSVGSTLAIQAPPNEGRQSRVSRLRQSTTGDVGFDIYSRPNGEGDTASNTAYASLRRAGRTRLYRVSLRTGKAKRVAGNGVRFRNVTDIAIRP